MAESTNFRVVMNPLFGYTEGVAFKVVGTDTRSPYWKREVKHNFLFAWRVKRAKSRAIAVRDALVNEWGLTDV